MTPSTRLRVLCLLASGVCVSAGGPIIFALEDPADPLEEFRRSVLGAIGSDHFGSSHLLIGGEPIGAASPFVLSAESSGFGGANLFDSVDREVESMFSSFGDPVSRAFVCPCDRLCAYPAAWQIFHSGLGRGFHLDRSADGAARLTMHLHGVVPSSLRVNVIDGHLLAVSATQRLNNGVASFERSLSLPDGDEGKVWDAARATASYDPATEQLNVTVPATRRADSSKREALAASLEPRRKHHDKQQSNLSTWRQLERDVRSSVGELETLSRSATDHHRASKWLHESARPGRLLDTLLGGHFGTFERAQAISEPRGTRWSHRWAKGATGDGPDGTDEADGGLQLAVSLPREADDGSSELARAQSGGEPDVHADGHMLTVDVPGVMRRTVQLPSRVGHNGIRYSWEPATGQMAINLTLADEGEDGVPHNFQVPLVIKDEL